METNEALGSTAAAFAEFARTLERWEHTLTYDEMDAARAERLHPSFWQVVPTEAEWQRIAPLTAREALKRGVWQPRD